MTEARSRRPADGHAGDGPDLRRGCEAFIDGIIDASRRYGYRADESPGPDDLRLRGARQ